MSDTINTIMLLPSLEEAQMLEESYYLIPDDLRTGTLLAQQLLPTHQAYAQGRLIDPAMLDFQAARDKMQWHAEKGHWSTWPLDELTNSVLSALGIPLDIVKRKTK